MPRSEARLQFGMWRDGLDGLGPHAKLLYCVLLTEPTLNGAGVGAVRLSRWACNASLSEAEALAALAELTAGHPRHARVVIDGNTEEILVRTIMRHEGVESMPYVLKGAIAVALQTASALLRWVLAQELRKLPAKKPDTVSPKTKRLIVYPDPHAGADELDPGRAPEPPETLFRPFLDPSDRVSREAANGHQPGIRGASKADKRDEKKGSPKGLEREGGSGGGSGSTCSVGGSVGESRARVREAVPTATPTPRGPAVYAQTAHSGRAHRLVEDYAKTCRRRPPSAVLAKLGVEADALLAEDWSPDEIAAALAALGRKGLGPGALASVAHELANSDRDDAPRRDVYKIPDDELTDDDVDELIGPMMHRAGPPDDVVAQGVEAMRAWNIRDIARVRADRRTKAIEVRAQRLAKVARLDEHRRSG